MPDQSSAASEHALLQEITAPLSTLPDNPVPAVADVEFPLALRGYDRLAVDAYVRKTSQLVAELQATRSPEAAIRRALERVGDEVSGILQRAHETAEQITSQSRSEAEDRLDAARKEAAEIVAGAQKRVKELDAETDRIWAERHRIVEDTRDLARQLLGVAESAVERFPPAEDTGSAAAIEAAQVEAAAADAEVSDETMGPDGPLAAGEPRVFDGEAELDGEAALPDADATVAMPPVEPAGNGESPADDGGERAEGGGKRAEDGGSGEKPE
jgi:cell division septum initiation protein DivIVA